MSPEVCIFYFSFPFSYSRARATVFRKSFRKLKKLAHKNVYNYEKDEREIIIFLMIDNCAISLAIQCNIISRVHVWGKFVNALPRA